MQWGIALLRENLEGLGIALRQVWGARKGAAFRSHREKNFRGGRRFFA